MGRHTTTHRELFLMQEGVLILDTPGMRSLLPWEADVGMEAMFGDIERLVNKCRFFDCQHKNEPGCAIREALNNGTLEAKRWESRSKLQREIVNFENRKKMKQKLKEKQIIKQKTYNRANRPFAKSTIKNMELG